MRAEIEIDSESPDKIEKILSPSLESRGKVELSTSADKDSVDVDIETDGLGPLRGTTDNVFRLAGLAKKIYEER
jgi:tRNA threonylcarbamoyladenosine modification (KEOPS) complex  Pcc1 subunit